MVARTASIIKHEISLYLKIIKDLNATNNGLTDERINNLLEDEMIGKRGYDRYVYFLLEKLKLISLEKAWWTRW